MASLKQIIEKHIPVFTSLGEEENNEQLNEDIENIRNELTGLIKANTKKISLFSVTIISVIVICVILSIIFINQGNLSLWANICTITGVAPLTLVGFIKDWWKDKTNANTLLRLIDSLDKESFYPILAVFVKMLSK